MSRSMFGWDLPPGCRISDIPGNRPEDLVAEAQADALYEVFPDMTDEQLEKMFVYLAKVYEDGYQQSTSDAAEAKQYENETNRQYDTDGVGDIRSQEHAPDSAHCEPAPNAQSV